MVCSCAQTLYRNNPDGTRDYKLKGVLGCTKCRGHGRCVRCPDCTGAGMTDSKVCTRCYGSGYVPGRRRPGGIA